MAIFLILLNLYFVFPLFAHPVDLGTLRVHQQAERLEFQLDISLPVAAELTGLSEQRLIEMPNNLEHAFYITTFAEHPVQFRDGACQWQEGRAAILDSRLNFSISAFCPTAPGEWKLELPFLSRAPKTFELITTYFPKQGEKCQWTLNTRDYQLSQSHGGRHSWGEFIKLGILHIGVGLREWWGPQGLHLPDGIDHILFVIALILSTGQIIEVLKTVSGFTLGHSIALALATFQFVNVPSRIIEPAIALSIAFVAGECLFFNRSRQHWRLALVFGLIHGLGFATALADLRLSTRETFKALIGFNLGVEVGQIVIVALIFPLIYGLEKFRIGKRFVLPAIAASILAAGIYWFVRRALNF